MTVKPVDFQPDESAVAVNVGDRRETQLSIVKKNK